jgi:predicted nuclease of predicted toxin-antitoxin system
VKFFFDNDIGRPIADGLKRFGEDVCHLQDHFREDVTDIEYLEYIGKQGWFLITHDKNIRKNKAERTALKKHRVGAFFLGGKSMSIWQRVKQVVTAWEQIKQKAQSEKRPFAFVVSRAGKKLKKVHID